MSFKLLDKITGNQIPTGMVIYTIPESVPEGALLSYYEPYWNLDEKALGGGFQGQYGSAEYQAEAYYYEDKLGYRLQITSSNSDDMRYALVECRRRLGLEVVDIRPRFIIRLPKWLGDLVQRLRLITIEVQPIEAKNI